MAAGLFNGSAAGTPRLGGGRVVGTSFQPPPSRFGGGGGGSPLAARGGARCVGTNGCYC
jgi:hypothetical protein